MIRRLLTVPMLFCAALAGALDWSPHFLARASGEAGPEPGSLNTVIDTGFDFHWWSLEGQVLAGVSYREGRVGWDWSAAWLAFDAEWWRFQAGLWPDSPGPALFKSLVPGFTSGSGTEFLATAGSAPAPVPLKASVRGTIGEWTWTNDVSPWRPELPLPNSDSRWFPRKDIPTEVTGLIYPLGPLRMQARPGHEGERWSDWPVRSEVRWSSLWGDATAGIFHGPDTQVFFPLRLMLVNDLVSGDRFDLVLSPLVRPVTMVWGTLQVPWGPFLLWTEQRWTNDRLRTEDGFDLEQGATFALLRRSATTAVWEGLAGGAWSVSDASWGSLRVWGEASLYRDLRNPERPAPDFTQGLVLGLALEGARGEARIDVLGGLPWDTSNGWVWTRATWNVQDGRSIWVGVPYFFGGSRTPWGQFSENKGWAVGTAWQD